jgi:hypothetical protein
VSSIWRTVWWMGCRSCGCGLHWLCLQLAAVEPGIAANWITSIPQFGEPSPSCQPGHSGVRDEREGEFHIFPSLFPLPEAALCNCWIPLTGRRRSPWSRTYADGWGDTAMRRNTPRCGARTRSGEPCQRKALKNGRCPNHGGLSTGPRTREGRARIADAARRRWEAWRRERGEVGPTTD